MRILCGDRHAQTNADSVVDLIGLPLEDKTGLIDGDHECARLYGA